MQIRRGRIPKARELSRFGCELSRAGQHPDPARHVALPAFLLRKPARKCSCGIYTGVPHSPVACQQEKLPPMGVYLRMRFFREFAHALAPPGEQAHLKTRDSGLQNRAFLNTLCPARRCDYGGFTYFRAARTRRKPAANGRGLD